MLIVVTGKTGVGKTTLLNNIDLSNIYFADDFVKNNLYKNNFKLTEKIAKTFGDVKSNESIDVKKLGRIILNDKKKLKKLSKMVRPHVKKWLRTLPYGSVVEMAAYINYERWYRKYFNFVILITRIESNLNGKFDYLDKKVQPIINKEIKSDSIIENNSSISSGAEKLRSTIENIRRG